VDAADADAWVAANPGIGVKRTSQLLTEIPGSNGQAWYVNAPAGTHVKNWIAPTDVPSTGLGFPSYGFEAKLLTNAGVQIPPATGVWVVDYYAGIVMFQLNYTPADLGYGIPRITFYQYIGTKGAISSSSTTNIRHIAVDTLLAVTDDTIICDTTLGVTMNVTLPDVTTLAGKTFRIKNNGLGFVKIIPADPAQLIEGGVDYTLYTPNEAIMMQTDGFVLFIV
jgi:hypothetical protein